MSVAPIQRISRKCRELPTRFAGSDGNRMYSNGRSLIYYKEVEI